MRKMGIEDRAEFQTSTGCRWWSMSKNLTSRSALVVCAGLAVLGLTCVLWAQSNPTPQSSTPSPNQKQDQNIPDAPSAAQPPKAPAEAPLPPAANPQDQP